MVSPARSSFINFLLHQRTLRTGTRALSMSSPRNSANLSSSSSSSFTRPDGAVIHYEVRGSGPQPILLLAPGGMRSRASWWRKAPWNPMERLLQSEDDHESFTLIAIDQRYSHVDDDDANDGSLSCNLADDHNVDWTTFRDDQLALLDHLRINKPCHIVGSCIGPSYALQLLRDAPSRFAKAVLLQPIGVAKHTTEEVETWDGLNAGAESHWFGVWANAMLASGQVSSRKVLDRMYDNMFGSKAPSRDFVFTISREEMRRINHNLLVFCGIDMFHPAEIAREICRLAPNASEVVERWRNDGSERLEEAHGLIRSFLQE